VARGQKSKVLEHVHLTAQGPYAHFHSDGAELLIKIALPPATRKVDDAATVEPIETVGGSSIR
jgi:hypothetical protein